MSERELKRRSPASKQTNEDAAGAQSAPAAPQATSAAKQGEKIKADLDNLLDEIDEVLEDNAEEFVRSYVQKGGE
ncbi:MAG: ubiquitin-like protein Pup [Acidimicrobiales bacterium]